MRRQSTKQAQSTLRMVLSINFKRKGVIGLEENKLSMFLEHHQEESQKEIDAYGYLMKQAIEHIANGEFKKAAVYHENITRSLNELQQLRNRKETHDEMWLKWKQIQSEQAGETIRRNFF